MNSATQQFIEDTINGGWKPNEALLPKFFLWRTPFKVFVAGSLCSLYFETNIPNAEKESVLLRVSDILIGPLAWQAVGKTRGWIPECNCGKEHPGDYFMTHGEWRSRFHMFIDHLADGKTIEEALQALN